MTVINQEQDLRRSLCECYELYCDGYSFLDNLGLGCGLTVIVPPPQYGADNWYELSREKASTPACAAATPDRRS